MKWKGISGTVCFILFLYVLNYSAGDIRRFFLALGLVNVPDIELDKPRNEKGDTILHLAIRQHRLEFAKDLVAMGANPFKENNVGETPVDLAMHPDRRFRGFQGWAYEQFKSGELNYEAAKQLIKRQDAAGLKALLESESFYWKQATTFNFEIESLPYTAVRAHCLPCIQVLAQAGHDLAYQWSAYSNLLEEAIDQGTGDILRLILETGGDLQGSGISLRQLLLRAIKNGNPDIVSVLLRAGADSTITGDQGQEAIYNTIISPYASEAKAKIMGLILQAGANPDVPHPIRITPLHEAVTRNDQLVVKVLLENGANLEARDENGYTPLMYAVMHGWADMVSDLIESGGNVRHRALRGLTPLHLTMIGEAVGTVNDQVAARIAGLLIDAGADVNALSHYFPENCCLNFEHVFPEEKTSLNSYTPLYLAAGYGLEKTVKVLLAAGANPEALPGTCMSPLAHAIFWAHLANVNALLDAGADVNARTRCDVPPMRMVAEENIHEEFEGRHQRVQIADLLLAHGADLGYIDAKSGSTLLMHAINGGYPDLVRWLLDKGADVNARNKNDETPLELAVAGAHPVFRTESHQDPEWLDMIRLLVKRGANINESVYGSFSLLHSAVFQEWPEAVDLLLQLGISPGIRDSSGETAYEAAIDRGYTDIAARIEKFDTTLSRPAEE